MALDPVIGWILALALALLLGAAASHKGSDLSRFRAVLGGYRLLPRSVVLPAAIVVIAVEITAAALLVVPSARGRGGPLAAALLLVYGLALAANLVRGNTRIDCGCFGFGRGDQIRWWMVGRNLALAAAALAASLPSTPRPITALDWLTVVGTVSTVGILSAAFGRLASGTAPVTSGGAR